MVRYNGPRMGASPIVKLIQNLLIDGKQIYFGFNESSVVGGGWDANAFSQRNGRDTFEVRFYADLQAHKFANGPPISINDESSKWNFNNRHHLEVDVNYFLHFISRPITYKTSIRQAPSVMNTVFFDLKIFGSCLNTIFHSFPSILEPHALSSHSSNVPNQKKNNNGNVNYTQWWVFAQENNK